MPEIEWVLDTWLLETAQDPSLGKLSVDSLSALFEILRSHRIALDHGGEIRREYAKHIRTGLHVEEWWKLMVSRAGKIVWRAGNVPAEHRQMLLRTLRFDPSDIVFVGVAFEGPDKLLVSQDSDYTGQVREYVQIQMGVAVLDVDAALGRA